MERIICLVDGFNLYHSLDENKLHHYKWLNLKALAKSFLKKNQKLNSLYYFTAYTYWNIAKKQRHKIYVEALKRTGVRVIFGEFKQKRKKCPNCKKIISTFEEKRTDVNIAVKLLTLANEDKFDMAMIISGDSDFIPAIQEVQLKYPDKKITIISPFGRKTEALKKSCNFHMKIKAKHLKSNLLENKISENIKKPLKW